MPNSISTADIISYIRKDGFETKNSNIFKPLDAAFCHNELMDRSLIIKEYSTDIDSKTIINDLIEIKNSIRELEINTWNTYFLVCITSDEEKEFSIDIKYEIERNSKIFRKYVVQDINDLRRIPFLDLQVGDVEDISHNIEDIAIYSSDEQVKNLIRYLLDFKEESVKRTEIENIIDNFFELGDETDEVE